MIASHTTTSSPTGKRVRVLFNTPPRLSCKAMPTQNCRSPQALKGSKAPTTHMLEIITKDELFQILTVWALVNGLTHCCCNKAVTTN